MGVKIRDELLLRCLQQEATHLVLLVGLHKLQFEICHQTESDGTQQVEQDQVGCEASRKPIPVYERDQTQNYY